MKTFTQISKFAAMAAIAAIGFSLYACEEKEKYKSVKIGNQTWMAENLNEATEGSKCYDDKPENCEKYGRLYFWEAAKDACPAGWHLPSKDEWQTLVDFAGGDGVAGTKLKAREGWDQFEKCSGDFNEIEERCYGEFIKVSGDGTDDYGFAALPGGYGNYSDGNFYYVGSYGGWWSSTEDGYGYAWHRDMRYSIEDVIGTFDYKTSLFSVRCIKD